MTSTHQITCKEKRAPIMIRAPGYINYFSLVWWIYFALEKLNRTLRYPDMPENHRLIEEGGEVKSRRSGGGREGWGKETKIRIQKTNALIHFGHFYINLIKDAE